MNMSCTSHAWSTIFQNTKKVFRPFQGQNLPEYPTKSYKNVSDLGLSVKKTTINTMNMLRQRPCPSFALDQFAAQLASLLLPCLKTIEAGLVPV